jgi:hypothetical protein
MIFRGNYVWEFSDEYDRTTDLVGTLYSCPECHSPSIGIAATDYRDSESTKKASLGEQMVWLPEHATGKDFPDVPEHIAAAADEAYQCLSIGAFRGAVILARAVVEATCKDKGVNSGKLYDKIEKMGEQHMLKPAAVEEAHEIRFLGNDMAHGDFAASAVEKDDAEDMLRLMSSILNEVYQDPANLARIKAKRLAKKQQNVKP